MCSIIHFRNLRVKTPPHAAFHCIWTFPQLKFLNIFAYCFFFRDNISSVHLLLGTSSNQGPINISKSLESFMRGQLTTKTASKSSCWNTSYDTRVVEVENWVTSRSRIVRLCFSNNFLPLSSSLHISKNRDVIVLACCEFFLLSTWVISVYLAIDLVNHPCTYHLRQKVTLVSIFAYFFLDL